MEKGKSELLQKVGQRVKEIRLSKNIQQRELAEEFSSEQSRISKIEIGSREPGTDFYYWFAKRTQCSLDYLICGKTVTTENGNEDDNHPKITFNGELQNLFSSFVGSEEFLNLLDSFIESDEFVKYMAQRKLLPQELTPRDGPLLHSEMELIQELRKMDIYEAFEIIRGTLNQIKKD